MHRINESQVSNLSKAIKLASGHGSCRYFENGKCLCVLANLAQIEGVPLSTIAKWDNSDDNSALVIFGKKNAPLKEYPLELLVYLQAIWDNKDITEDKAKMDMSSMMYTAAGENYIDINSLAFYLKLTLVNLSDKE